jgi:hypothetical protein
VNGNRRLLCSCVFLVAFVAFKITCLTRHHIILKGLHYHEQSQFFFRSEINAEKYRYLAYLNEK